MNRGQESRWLRHRLPPFLAAGAAVIALLGGHGVAAADAFSHLRQMSVEQLTNMAVTSVSKRPEPLGGAPAAIFVITHDDIQRSGARSIPEMLRLAPNLEVMQTSPANYVITARGFSGNSADQNFSNKLLVLIDGRSVYNPLFSGMYWDMQDVLPEDIDRIEIISGPGATLFGANAVNGVINIITRSADATQGLSVDAGYGTRMADVSIQYGGELAPDANYRIYARAFRDRSFQTLAGASAHDGWDNPQAGFRIDWNRSTEDAVMVQGDYYRGEEDQSGAPAELVEGAHLEARWRHKPDSATTLTVLGYYDQAERMAWDHNGGFIVRSFDLEMQDSLALGSWNNIVWGLGDRISPYTIVDRIAAANSLLFVPDKRTLNLAEAFLEDRIPVTPDLDLTLALKLEDDPYSGIAPMPSGRIAWRPTEKSLVWAAVSRAVRSPTPFDHDVEEKLGPVDFLNGNPQFKSEKLVAYELGYRQQIGADASVSVSAFANDYADLKSIEVTPVTFIPIFWGNGMKGQVYGIEAWGSYDVADWWRLSGGLDWLQEDLGFAKGASGLLGKAQAGDDPQWRANLRSTLEIAENLTVDAQLRFQSALPNPHVPSYVELNARAGLMFAPHLALSLSGFNLLHASHQEYPAPADAIPRSVFLDLRWSP